MKNTLAHESNGICCLVHNPACLQCRFCHEYLPLPRMNDDCPELIRLMAAERDRARAES
jgi:hypothetical protein